MKILLENRDVKSSHIISSSIKSQRPSRIVFVDTETVSEKVKNNLSKHELRLGVGLFWNPTKDTSGKNTESLEFTSKLSFWSWLLSKVKTKETLYLTAHNLSFDMLVLDAFNQMAKQGWLLTFIYEKGITTIITWKLPTPEFLDHLKKGRSLETYEGDKWLKTIMGIDNANLFPGKLSSWGKQLDFPKLSMPKVGQSDKTWFVYCHRDVDIMFLLWKNWLDFLTSHQLGSFRYTIASQAMTSFRHKFMTHKIHVHDDEVVIKLERQSYRGGRVQASFVGELVRDHYYKLDINSMYPYVMVQESYPTQLNDYSSQVSLPQLKFLLKSKKVIAEVLLSCDEPVFPVRFYNKNLYPTGTFITTLCTPELIYALEHNWVREIFRLAWYSHRPIFQEYVRFFYDLKIRYTEEDNKLNRFVVKLLLNSLYGKFGQKNYNTRVIGYGPIEDFYTEYCRCSKTGEHYIIIHAGGCVIEKKESGEGYNSFVAIASHVTAEARILLWKIISKAGKDNVFYCDTDSVIVNQVGYENLVSLLHSTQLGALKVEEESNQVVIYAPKDYVFGQHIVRKGVSDSAKQIGSNTFEMLTWPTIKGHLQKNLLDGYYNKTVQKTLRRKCTWGLKQPSGNVTPFHLPHDLEVLKVINR